MKKVLLFMAIAAIASFTSCSKDDAESDEQSSCESCMAQGENIKMCDNGDGTYTLNANGESETVKKSELGGLSSKQYMESLCAVLNLTP